MLYRYIPVSGTQGTDPNIKISQLLGLLRVLTSKLPVPSDRLFRRATAMQWLTAILCILPEEEFPQKYIFK